MVGITLDEAQSMVGIGWGGILTEFYSKLPPEAYINTVKEKYGVLNIYGGGYSVDLEIEAMEKSSKICEICGDGGELRELPWVLTLCDNHYQLRLKRNV